jgi:AcrR family transcriptional regulator
VRTKSDSRRQSILDSAAKVFQETGFERASMSEICLRLGCSKATLYNYFPSKDALFFEVVMASNEAEYLATHDALDPSIEDITQALENFGCRFLSFIYSPAVQAVRRMVVSEAGRSELGRVCYEKGPEQSERDVARFLQQAMDAGKLRQADSRLAALHLRGLMESEWIDRFMFQLLDGVSEQDIKLSVGRAVAAFMGAYGPRSGA